MRYLIILMTVACCFAGYSTGLDNNGDHIVNYPDLIADPNELADIASNWLSLDPAYAGDAPVATSFTAQYTFTVNGNPVTYNPVVSEAKFIELQGSDDIFGGQLSYVITAISSELTVQADIVGAIPIEPNDLPYTIPAYGNGVYVWASESGTFTIKYKAVNLSSSAVVTVTFPAVGGDDSKLEFSGQGYVVIADSDLDGARPDTELGFACWFRTNNPRGYIFKRGNTEFGLINGKLYGSHDGHRVITQQRFDDGKWYCGGFIITNKYEPRLAANIGLETSDPNFYHYYDQVENPGYGNYAIEIGVIEDNKDYYIDSSVAIEVNLKSDNGLLAFDHTGTIDNGQDIYIGYQYIGSIDRCMIVTNYSAAHPVMGGTIGWWFDQLTYYNMPGRNATSYGFLGFNGETPEVEYRFVEDGPVFNSSTTIDPNAVSTNGETVKKKMIRKYEKVRVLDAY